MGTRKKKSVGSIALLALGCVVAGLGMFSALPSGGEFSLGVRNAQAFARLEPAAPFLGDEAIAAHAMIEFIFAPQRLEPETTDANEPAVADAPTSERVESVSAQAPSQAQSTVAVQAAAPTSIAARGQAALARIPVSPGSVGFTIDFLPGRDGYGGLTYPDTRRIEIFVSSAWSDAHLAHVVAHEIGHAFDMTQNSRADREQWRSARGISSTTRWWADPYTSDFATPGGDFAECFAAWSVGSSSTRSAFGSCAGTASLMSELVWG